MDKYKLPTVESLKAIGFCFEYARKKDFVTYINSFIVNNIKELIKLYPFRDVDYDSEGNIIDSNESDDSDQPNRVELWEPEKDLVSIVDRLKGGVVLPSDYIFHAYPTYKNDAKVLYKIYNQKLRTYYGAKGNLINRGERWSLSQNECINECMYHRILDDLIFAIRDEGLILPSELPPAFIKIKEALNDPDEPEGGEGSLTGKSYVHQKTKELEYLHQDFFAAPLTLEKSARLVIRKANLKGPIISHIDQKERTLNYYLHLQSKSVKKAKDNKKNDKGINKNKRDEVINIFKSNPKLTYLKISEMTGYDRKTIAKYIKSLISG